MNNDLTIAASFGYTSAAWSRVVALLNAGRIAPGQIVTHRYPLERFAEGLAALESGEGARGKVHARDHQPPTHPLSRPYGSLSGSSPGSARRKSKSQPWSACSTCSRNSAP